MARRPTALLGRLRRPRRTAAHRVDGARRGRAPWTGHGTRASTARVALSRRPASRLRAVRAFAYADMHHPSVTKLLRLLRSRLTMSRKEKRGPAPGKGIGPRSILPAPGSGQVNFALPRGVNFRVSAREGFITSYPLRS